MASTRVNQAPSGTFVSADDRYRPSSAPKARNPIATTTIGSRQMITATREIMKVVMNVTKITHTPYA
jgi:hypothetical protein